MRSKPFSVKQKKIQLQEKRARKRDSLSVQEDGKANLDHDESRDLIKKDKLKSNNGRLVSIFETESKKSIEEHKFICMQPLTKLPIDSMEISIDQVFSDASIEIPFRPEWDANQSKESLERNEELYFKIWLENIEKTVSNSSAALNYYEKNLEVWRQLWRVVEISDIILVVVDIRHPILHFPPSLYSYIRDKWKKDIILIFNKTDLVSKQTLTAWREYFMDRFPELNIVDFSAFSFESDNSRKKYKNKIAARNLLQAIREINPKKDRTVIDWEYLLNGNKSEELADAVKHHAFSKNYLTIGLVGHPNVGKSSLINGLVGKSVVSASRTPGHTKHFQTIHLSPTLRLCDCPGLVFPAKITKQLQVITGLFNIAQVRDPYWSVHYVAERLPLVEILDLNLNSDLMEGFESDCWSTWKICEAFAFKRGFLTAKAGRPDIHRAAGFILRLVCDGRILMSWKPSGFFKNLNAENPESFVLQEMDEVALKFNLRSAMVKDEQTLEDPNDSSCSFSDGDNNEAEQHPDSTELISISKLANRFLVIENEE